MSQRDDINALFTDGIPANIRSATMRDAFSKVALEEDIEALSFSGYSGATGLSGYSGYSGIGSSGYSGKSGFSGKSPDVFYLNGPFTKTNTTLATITDGTLSLTSGNLAVNSAYKFRAVLFVSCSAASGHKYAVAVSGGAGCTYDILSHDLTTKAYTITSRQINTVNTGVGATSSTSVRTIIEGYIQGTGSPLSVQFGLNAGTTSASVLTGSFLEVYYLGPSMND